MRTLQKKDNKKKESSWEGEEDEVEATGDRGRTEAEVRRLQKSTEGDISTAGNNGSEGKWWNWWTWQWRIGGSDGR